MTARKTDVQMDERGRIVIPSGVRKQLGIDGQSADVRVTIEVLSDA